MSPDDFNKPLTLSHYWFGRKFFKLSGVPDVIDENYNYMDGWKIIDKSRVKRSLSVAKSQCWTIVR